MKKTYTAPNFTVTEFETEEILAGSSIVIDHKDETDASQGMVEIGKIEMW